MIKMEGKGKEGRNEEGEKRKRKEGGIAGESKKGK